MSRMNATVTKSGNKSKQRRKKGSQGRAGIVKYQKQKTHKDEATVTDRKSWRLGCKSSQVSCRQTASIYINSIHILYLLQLISDTKEKVCNTVTTNM